MWADQATQRDLTNPLLPNSPGKNEPTAPTVSDIDGSERWFRPSDYEEDDAPPELRPERMSSLRTFRKYLHGYFKYWIRPLGLVMYLTYLVFVITITAAKTDADSHKYYEGGNPTYYTIAFFLYLIWLVIYVSETPTIILGRRQSLAFGGLYLNLINVALFGGTISVFLYSFTNESFPFEQLTLVLMACTVYVCERYGEPRYRQLDMFYKGCTSRDQVDKLPPISDIGSNALMKLAINSAEAVEIPQEAIQNIQTRLSGLKIRQGETEALDDWMVVIYKLSKVVSISPPLASLRSKSWLSPAQYRNLVCQLIISMRLYMDTGRIDRVSARRTAPLSFGEALIKMAKLSWQVPFSFLLALVPRSLQTIAMSAGAPIGTKMFMDGIMAMGAAYVTGDFEEAKAQQDKAKVGFAILVAMLAANPVFTTLSTIVESNYSSRMIAQCRSKMFTRLVKGGTEYSDKNRPGAIVDGFSNHLTQVLLFGQTFFISIIPQIFGLIAGVTFSGINYPFAVVLFISIVPIILSVDHFLRVASEAAQEKAITESKVMGKVTSAVECRPAIRASNAGNWIASDMKDLFEQLRMATRNSWLRSDRARNFMEWGATFFTVLVSVPLGLGVINGSIDLGTFGGLSQSLGAMVMPLHLLGLAQSNTMIYSASIQAVSDLMDINLDEEPPPKKKDKTPEKATLKPLSDSVNVKDVVFSYTADSPNVLKGVDVDVNKGTYIVLCGESGSGKSTVLNLLMRFFSPKEGSIKWDGTSIYDTSLSSFRDQVGVMFQKTMIYQASIRDNIMFGMPEVPGAVEKAAQDAEIADVINRLPEGYDTIIGGDAVTGMSGGQLQRICMARALYRKPSVLLLDEATSALDKETEYSIVETLVHLRDNDGLTLVSVSHHPETALKADKIVVLAQGVLAEEGTYDELAGKEGGIFRRIVEAGDLNE